ncbi:MAG: LTA synthase family protein [Bacteroidales bacterium]|nr:LTA synthase family protein [Bacteroidales bacterium]
MKKNLIFILSYFLFWLLYFLFVKSFFILFNLSHLKQLSISLIPQIFWYGLRLDLSASAYVLIVPFLLLLISNVFNFSWWYKVIKVYTYILLAIFTFLVIVDAELYAYWGFRLDLTPLQYIDTPGAMLASATGWTIIRQLLLGIIIFLLFSLIYRRIFSFLSVKPTVRLNFPSFIILLIIFASLIIPIRGGLGLAPLNTGSAYFSNNAFANHAAINVVWNVGFAFLQTETRKNPYRMMSTSEAENIINQYLGIKSDSTQQLIRYEKSPNVILIVLESFMAKLLPEAGGDLSLNATPQLRYLIKEGIFFPNVYSTGTRSDKGLISIICGFPAFPNVLVMRFPDKTEKLPAIAKDLRKEGYSTAYYYGGDIDFVSMRSFAKNAGYNKIVSMSDFPSSTYNAKWGVHDHVVFERLLSDIDTASKPFFYTFFTLSSHEPFDVPMKTVIEGNDDDHRFLNSVYYTDSCLGSFIEKAKQKPWWNNTLVVLIADHGVLRLGVHDAFDPERFHIPMLWLGGVVQQPAVVKSVVSQTDVPYTLLMQLGIYPQKPYCYSRNVLSPNYKGYAVGAFNSGIVVFSDSATVAFDYTDQKIKLEKGSQPQFLLQFGKAYLQKSYDDFLQLK